MSLLAIVLAATLSAGADDWTQFKGDSRRSGSAPDRSVTVPLGLVAAIPLKDAVLTAPVAEKGRVYVVDASGVAYCIDVPTRRVVWEVATTGGGANVNNVSSPALAGNFLHFGTTAGTYFVLDKARGTVVKKIPCGEPVFTSPVVANGRVYFATLGGRIHALEPDGTTVWVWDLVREYLGFSGNRWSGHEWSAFQPPPGKMTRFLCAREMAVHERTVVVPAGGAVFWLEDSGGSARLRAVSPAATLSLSLDDSGTAYAQAYSVDNQGRVVRMRLNGEKAEPVGDVPGTSTGTSEPYLLSFSSVSVRGQDVFRTRPQEGYGLCRHAKNLPAPECLGGPAAVAPPVLLRDQAVYGSLDGTLHVLPLAGGGKGWSFKTPFGRPISGPVAVSEGRIAFGGEDGHLYILGPGGNATLPSKDLELWNVRHPLGGTFTDARYDWYSSFGDFANTNRVVGQGVKPPFAVKWIRRFEGTTKHASTAGAGRLYTHTAEGQIFAVEQETGRLLWRVHSPGVFLSFTSPLYHRERLLVPQAGLSECRLRCLDAATGKLHWEAPFSGSPGWSRQQPPVVHKNLALYMFGTGTYGVGKEVRQGDERRAWLAGSGGVRSFPKSQRPLVRAYDLDTGRTAWEKDFSEYGAGGDDAGLCLMNDTLYYSCFFGLAAQRKGVTVALDPQTGRTLWTTTDVHTQGGCTISGDEGRLYLGGYNGGYVWCLNAADGSLLWKSDRAGWNTSNALSLGPRFLFAHAHNVTGNLLDKQTGKILGTVAPQARCTRFVLADPYLLGSNLDVYDLSDPRAARRISSGPRVDLSQCVASVVSNGRMFYTAQGAGLQLSEVYGDEAASFTSPWEKPSGVKGPGTLPE